MKSCSRDKLPVRLLRTAAAVAGIALGGCQRTDRTGWQGYVEGEFVHVAAPLAGALETLAVQRGARVAAGTRLFVLEHRAELATQREAAQRLRAAEARLADLKKGSRPTEVAALEARLEQARSAAELSRRELDRQQELFRSGVLAESEIDRARLTHERNMQAIEELVAQRETALLGARSDAVLAAEAEVAAARAAKERAEWAVAQKTQAAPADALVYDTLFEPGEFVPAGSPVVSLLPPDRVDVRFFVPEADLARIAAGDVVRVAITGRPEPLPARVAYVSPKPEYTPPVLYNRDNRAKLVFMIEAEFDPGAARDLHPGQPVDVTK